MSTDDRMEESNSISSVSELHDENWEAEMRDVLAETEHDTELGLQMAKDAQRLVAGELTEEEFHARYHDAVINEFGVDDRPLELPEESDEGLVDLLLGRSGDSPGFFERLADADVDGEMPRREVMQKAGAGAAILGAGAFTASGGADRDTGVASAAGDEQEDGTQWGMVINLENCDGCLACVTACEQENQTGAGENWMYVFTYDEPDQDSHNFLVRPCQHCTDAPCEKVCPTTARHTREKDGLVLTDYDVCIGCRYCQVACPYGVNYFQWGEPETPMDEIDPNHTHDERDRWVDSRPPRGVMGKCTMCPSRQDGNMGEDMIGTTACEDACAMDAIHFGDMNDPESDPNQHLEQYKADNPNDQSDWANRPDDRVSTFRLLEEIGTKPNVVYVGNEPGPNAEQVEGPVTYESMGQVDVRKEALDELTVGGSLG